MAVVVKSVSWIFILIVNFTFTYARRHHLHIETDDRRQYTLSTFGFLKHGTLKVNVSDLIFETELSKLDATSVGFTLDISSSTGASSYIEDNFSECILKEEKKEVKEGEEEESIVFFRFDMQKQKIFIERRGKAVQDLIITNNTDAVLWKRENRRDVRDHASDSYLFTNFKIGPRQKRDIDGPPIMKGQADPEATTKTGDGKIAGAEDDTNTGADQTGDENNETGPAGDTKNTDGGNDETKENETTKEKQTKGKNAGNENTDNKNAEDKNAAGKNTEEENTEDNKNADNKNAEDKNAADKNTEDSKNADDSNTDENNVKPTVGENDGEDDDKAGNAASRIIPLLTEIPIYKPQENKDMFNFAFLVAVTDDSEEGMYTLNFHNCYPGSISYTIDIAEINRDDGDRINYLSASVMPLPTLYFILSLVYITMAIVWNTVLCKSKESVYKVHYLMLVVTFVKSLSCLFHAINFHFIEKEGIHERAWAILFYIAYLTRGALLFVTIILIGAGWAFIKHVLSEREKKLFLIIIPLQILDNVAWIIVEESEEGQSQYSTWKQIFILIDLFCCGAILFPVVWSIKHLQDASRADGKAEFSLTKLKLFRQFYIMVVCYIYFTRIIVYLLQMTVPFRYEWLHDLFRELATILFFIVTAYKFQPATDNPYLQVPTDDEEELEMDEVVVGKSGALNNLKKVNQAYKDKEDGVKLRESSHEYD